ncbi:MAG: response regulator [Candidatus Thorarchaeota archaeon]
MNQTQIQKNHFKILVVDDEHEVQKAIVRTLKKSNLFTCDVFIASNGIEGLRVLDNGQFDLVISDFRMPKMNGIEFLNNVRERYPNIIRILITGYSEINVAKLAITKAKVHNYIEKPWDRNEFIKTVFDELINNNTQSINNNRNEDSSENYRMNDRVNEALEMIMDARDQMMNTTKIGSIKEVIVIELDSGKEFNLLSREINNLKNVNIDDMQIFENKYILKIGLYLDSFEKIV